MLSAGVIPRDRTGAGGWRPRKTRIMIFVMVLVGGDELVSCGVRATGVEDQPLKLFRTETWRPRSQHRECDFYTVPAAQRPIMGEAVLRQRHWEY